MGLEVSTVELTSIINDAYEERAQVDVFYADISIAFDVVNQMSSINKN